MVSAESSRPPNPLHPYQLAPIRFPPPDSVPFPDSVSPPWASARRTEAPVCPGRPPLSLARSPPDTRTTPVEMVKPCKDMVKKNSKGDRLAGILRPQICWTKHAHYCGNTTVLLSGVLVQGWGGVLSQHEAALPYSHVSTT